MIENCKIADLKNGDDFVGFYVLKRCELKEYDGGLRLDIELSDSTGRTVSALGGLSSGCSPSSNLIFPPARNRPACASTTSNGT